MGQNQQPELAHDQKRPARAQPRTKKASPNLTRARKKVARPSPSAIYFKLFVLIVSDMISDCQL